jgi:hypothetical protein
MPSIADIPESLLSKFMKRQFLEWLVNLFLPWVTKKELLFLWARFVNSPITPDDMAYVFGHDWKERGI